jgi:inorganic triphosphatase YgiF
VTESGHVEREIKLDADPDLVLPDLATVVPGVSVRRRDPVELDAIYFDADDLRLMDDGVTVRRRTGEGTRWTVKVAAEASGAAGAMARREIDVMDESVEPPAEVRRLVDRWLGDAPLMPVARLVSSRSPLDLRSVDLDRVVAEVDDDMVVVLDGVREVGRFREIEIELARGLSDAEKVDAATVVDAVAASLVAAGARRDTMRPKVDRALTMLGRRSDPRA